jgi:hypothetical protein
MKHILKTGVTLIEAVISLTLLMVLLGVGFSFLLVQADLAKQQSSEAWGNVESQQAFDKVGDAVRDCVLDDTTTTFCAAATPTETMGKLRLFSIETANPYAFNSGDLMLQIAETKNAIIDVIDESGATLPLVYDADVSGTGRLRYGIDDDLDGTPDTNIRILSHDVKQFRVVDLGGQSIRVELILRHRSQGRGGELFDDADTNGHISVQYYDPATME